MKNLQIIFFLLIVFGLLDASYLTWEHYTVSIPPCSANIFVDCGRVLQSLYSTIYGVPLALLGALHYGVMLLVVLVIFFSNRSHLIRFLFLTTAAGIFVSAYLVYIQLVVIGAICLYCMASAMISLALYIIARVMYKEKYKDMTLKKIEVAYKFFGKPILFLVDPEFVHTNAMSTGEMMGKLPFVRWLCRKIFGYQTENLHQKVDGMVFENPVGLSAGYDYHASFTQILPSVGFGFETVGTITYQPCEGNTKPRLGRLPRSRSLLVNKGFRNPGAKHIIQKLSGHSFDFPLGISIGTTNSEKIKTQRQAIEDIVMAFTLFEKSHVQHSYYELNISCPNLKVPVTFYEPLHLKELLGAVNKLKLHRPVYIKMPIDKSDADVIKMLDIISKFNYINGVIFGNLQKNRKDPSFDIKEITSAGKGNFSGKPTEKRSNELISLAYKKYGKRFVIIGCGGIFSAEDAYRKIRLGATLVQMITGMIFEGPQVITQINRGLVALLKTEGISHISEAIGRDSQGKVVK